MCCSAELASQASVTQADTETLILRWRSCPGPPTVGQIRVHPAEMVTCEWLLNCTEPFQNHLPPWKVIFLHFLIFLRNVDVITNGNYWKATDMMTAPFILNGWVCPNFWRVLYRCICFSLRCTVLMYGDLWNSTVNSQQ